MKEYVQRVAMKAVLVHNGKILLLREASTYGEGTQTGRWHMPGGRINPGEPWQTALKREVSEETGITEFEIDAPIFVGEWFPTIKGVPTHIVAMFHLCHVTNPVVLLSEEHDDYRWVSADDWRELDVMEPEDTVLEIAIKELAS
jgi:8-oxo-dGTP diphosphatase